MHPPDSILFLEIQSSISRKEILYDLNKRE